MEELQGPQAPKDPDDKIDAEKLSSPENEKVQIVPVEQLIPDIKPPFKKSIRGVDYRTNDFRDEYSATFLESYLGMYTRYEETFDFLKERFSGQVVVDFGSGDSVNGYFLALLFGAKGYVGVDSFHSERLKNHLTHHGSLKIFNSVCPHDYDTSSRPELKELIPASVIADDMLSFLKRLPDNSVSIFTFGIDNNVIPDRKYREAAAKEIPRVLNESGVYLTYESDISRSELVKLQREQKGSTLGLFPFATTNHFFVKSDKQK